MSENETVSRNLKRIEFYLPKWVEMLSDEHEMKQQLMEILRKCFIETKDRDHAEREILGQLEKMKDIEKVSIMKNPDTSEEDVMKISVNFDESCYYKIISVMAGIPIEGEYQLISMIREFAGMKEEYGKVIEAVENVRNTGYAVMKPSHGEIHLEQPVITQQGNKYGVKIKASSSVIHMLKVNVETEISPIVGKEQQAKDLIDYIKESSEKDEDGLWETNIFGKSIEQLVEEGISSQINSIGEEGREKIQKIVQRIMDESANGFICIIL